MESGKTQLFQVGSSFIVDLWLQSRQVGFEVEAH